MNDPASASYYPSGPESAPISYWHLWAPIFQQLGIDPASIPNFAPPAAPPADTSPPGIIRFMAPGMSPYNDLASNGAPQSPAALSQAGLQLAQLGQPTQPTWATRQQTPRGLLDAGAFAQSDPQQAELQRRRMMGLLSPLMFGTGA